MDIIALVIGFIFGIILMALAIEIGTKRTTGGNPSSKHTKDWNISEISNPKIMAEYLSDIDIPKNSKLIVNKYKDKEVLQGLNAKEHRGIRGNFIVGDDRALILAGPMKKNELGIWTVEKDIVEKLNREFDEMWMEGAKLEFEQKMKNKIT